MDNLHESEKQPESNSVHPSSLGDLETQESQHSHHENALLPHPSDAANSSVSQMIGVGKSDFQESKPAESCQKIGLFLEEDEGKIVVETQESQPSDHGNAFLPHPSDAANISVGKSDSQESDPVEFCHKIGFSAEEDEGKIVVKTQEMEVVDNGKDGLEVSGMGELDDFGNNDSPEISEASKDGENKSVKCGWRIEVNDDTALIETDALENKQRRLKRLVETAKKKNIMADDEIVKNVGLNVDVFEGKNNEGKKVYSRKELEALRYQGLDGQKKTWVAAYCGLGPAVQKEYDELVDSSNATRLKQPHQPQQQKKKKNKRNQMAFNATPQFRNEAPTSIFGEESFEAAEYEIRNIKPMDPASGLFPVDEETSQSTGQEYMEDDDSDEACDNIQKPAFLVTGEPDFTSGPPEDGLEYLRRVRWEASRIPKVKVAKVDSSKLNKLQTVYMPQIPDIPKCPAHLVPQEEWEDAFLSDFSKLREALSSHMACEADSSGKMERNSNLNIEESLHKHFEGNMHENNGETSVTQDSSVSTNVFAPESCGNLETICCGTSDSVRSPNYIPNPNGASANYPTLSMILRMNSVARVIMLRKRINMAEKASILSRGDCVWLFALCAAVDSPLDADSCAALRSLLRKCASLRALKEELDEEAVMLNILATIAGKYFGQSEI